MSSAPRLVQFRNADLSLWQSAVDQVAAAHKKAAARAMGKGGPPERPDLSDPFVLAASEAAGAVSRFDVTTPTPPPAAGMRGIADTAAFCAATALRLARAKVKEALTGDGADVRRFQAEIGAKFGSCDPRWLETVEAYVAFMTTGGSIPYRTPQPDGFVIDNRLPANAKIAIVGDWGTGDDAARGVLQRIKARNPDVVFHLGDIYYSGTEHEARDYFYTLWQQGLGLPPVAWGGTLTDFSTRPYTFTLSGNHDMYAGGAPYYALVDMLGQPASCFCLRNDAWQFVALDTGLHDSRPGVNTETYLDPAEATWLARRVSEGRAANRKTFLLSHHQLYSAFEKFKGDPMNQTLYGQVKDSLAGVTAWLWGHEHDLIVYDAYPTSGPGVRGRCVGHGAFPVGIDEYRQSAATIGCSAGVTLGTDQDGGLMQHGYAWMELDDGSRAARITYYQYDWESGGQERALFQETL